MRGGNSHNNLEAAGEAIKSLEAYSINSITGEITIKQDDIGHYRLHTVYDPQAKMYVTWSQDMDEERYVGYTLFEAPTVTEAKINHHKAKLAIREEMQAVESSIDWGNPPTEDQQAALEDMTRALRDMDGE